MDIFCNKLLKPSSTQAAAGLAVIDVARMFKYFSDEVVVDSWNFVSPLAIQGASHFAKES